MVYGDHSDALKAHNNHVVLHMEKALQKQFLLVVLWQKCAVPALFISLKWV